MPAAGKVTVGLASHRPRVTDIIGSPPTSSRPGRGRWAPAYALLWIMVDHTLPSWCVARWFQRWTCNQQVTGSTPGRQAFGCNPGKVVHAHTCSCYQAVSEPLSQWFIFVCIVLVIFAVCKILFCDERKPLIFTLRIVHATFPSVFDTVGWATERASGL